MRRGESLNAVTANRMELTDEDAGAFPGDRQTLGLEDCERVSCGHSGDAVTSHEVVLAGQAIARAIDASVDLGPQLVSHAYVLGLLPLLRHRPRTLAGRRSSDPQISRQVVDFSRDVCLAGVGHNAARRAPVWCDVSCLAASGTGGHLAVNGLTGLSVQAR